MIQIIQYLYDQSNSRGVKLGLSNTPRNWIRVELKTKELKFAEGWTRLNKKPK